MLTFMVSVFEAVSTQGHTLGDTTCATSVCPKISCPHQAAESSAVKFSDIAGKIVVGTTPSYQPMTPVNRVLVINAFLWV